MLDKYKTILHEGTFEITEKKSRFIGRARPVTCEDEARAFIDEVRKQHRDARHNCFAFRIDANRPLERASDDGEPTGTAGMPMFDVLKGEGVFDCAVVVTRYFGGTLLGTGGLVRAYSQTAKGAMLAGEVIEKQLYDIWQVGVPYHLSQKMRYDLAALGVISNTEYAEDVTFTLLAEPQRAEEIMRSVMDNTSGTAELLRLEPVYCAMLDGELKILQ